MKTIICLGLLTAITAAPLPAQPADTTEPPTRLFREKMREKMRDKMQERLTPEQRERFEAARKSALADPEIAKLRENAESANRAFFEAMRKKMQKIDPGLEEILRKAGGPPPGGPHFGPGPDKRWERGFESLNEGERQRLQAARKIAAQTPSVQAAAEQRESAKTPEERQAANKAYFDAMRTAILQADPSLQPTLDKIRPPKSRKEKPGEDAKMEE